MVEEIDRLLPLAMVLWVPFVATFLLFFKFQLLYFVVVLTLYVLMLILTYLTLWIGLEGLLRGNFILIKHNEGKAENKNFSKLTENEISGHKERITQLMAVDKVYLMRKPKP